VELRDYVPAVRRHWVLVAAVVALAMGAAGMAAAVRPSAYRSSTVLFVSFGADTGADAAEQRIGSYLELLRGSRIATAVGQSVELSTRAVQRELVAERVPGTALLLVTATDSSSARATAIATAATAALKTVVGELEPAGSKTAVTVAQAPATAEVPAQLPRDLGLAALLGLVVALALVALREFTSAPVTSAADLRRRFGVDVVETISADDVANEPFRRLRTRLRAQAPPSGRMTLLVVGAGREDVAAATGWTLAEAFAETGIGVVVVDADLRAEHPATASGLTDVLSGERSIVDVLRTRGAVSFVRPGPVPDDPGTALATPALGEALGDLTNMFDVVLVLAPPALGTADAALLATLTDGVVVSARIGRTRAAQLGRAVESLRAVGADVVAAMLHPRRGRPLEAPAVTADAPGTDPSSAEKPPVDKPSPNGRPVSNLRNGRTASLG
jgi:Mrp family chromosome partitioning ATPase